MTSVAIGAYYLRQQLQDKKAKLKNAFLLLIKYRLHNPEDVEEFLKKWADLAEHCERCEPHTHAYEVSEIGDRLEIN